jgi:hypothetical protein
MHISQYTQYHTTEKLVSQSIDQSREKTSQLLLEPPSFAIALFKANPDNKDTLAKMYDAIPELQEKVDRMWERESNS